MYTLEQWMRLSLEKRIKVVVNKEKWREQEAIFREQIAHAVLKLLATQSEGTLFDQLQGKIFKDAQIIGARSESASVEQFKNQQLVTEMLHWVIEQLASKRYLDYETQRYEITELGRRRLSKQHILSK